MPAAAAASMEGNSGLTARGHGAGTERLPFCSMAVSLAPLASPMAVHVLPVDHMINVLLHA